MRTNQTLFMTLAAAVALSLSACGGSGGSAAVVPPVVAAPPAVASVTLSGLVTDMPIPNATVVVTVNGQNFTAPLPTGIDGSYQVEIQSEDPDALVRIEAFDPNGPARFSAIVDSFAGVEAAADADGTADDINVTNVTTAKVVLASRLTDDGSIDSVAELLDAAARIDTADMLELSAAIKLVVESIDGVTLPADIDDTLALAEAIVAGTSPFIADVEATAPGALASAVDLVLSDGNATTPFTATGAAGVYVGQDGMSIFALLPAGFGFTADERRDTVAGFDWVVSADGTLDLSFFGPEQYSESVTLLSRTSDVVNVVVRESDETGPGEPATAAYYSFVGEFDAQTLAGTYSTLDEPGQVTVFLDSGSGYDLDLASGAQGDTFDYSIEADGVLRIYAADGGVKNVRKLRGSTPGNLRLLVWESAVDGSISDLALVEALRTDGIPSSSGSDAAALLLAGSTYALTESGELSLFTFGASGTFSEISQFERDQSWDIDEASGTWTVDASGVIRTLFPGDATAGEATVTQGLGQDFMVVAADDGSLLQVTRVVAIDPALITGSFTVQNTATGAADGTVRLNADFTGIYVGADGVGEQLEWGLNANGRLVVESRSDAAFDNETTTFYLLAGSSGDVLRFVLVHRVNGALRASDTGAGAPDTLELLTLIRN